jgi:F-type H+-transporting ATPase subunit gamma
MSERLSDIRAHLAATRQLETVITAMRGVAAARTHEAQSRLAGVRAYADALGEAIGAALTLATAREERHRPPEEQSRAGHIVLAFCSAQGFVGAFNERVIASAKRVAAGKGGALSALIVVGERGEALAAEQGLELVWSAPMAAHVEEAPMLADKIAGAIYDRLGEDSAARVTLIHGAPERPAGKEIVERPLIPLDLGRFPAAGDGVPPLVSLSPEKLIASLAQEYVFAELCEAIVLSFAAENEARMRAMIAARDNVHRTLEELEARYRRQRQEQITEEIVELSARR